MSLYIISLQHLTIKQAQPVTRATCSCVYLKSFVILLMFTLQKYLLLIQKTKKISVVAVVLFLYKHL